MVLVGAGGFQRWYQVLTLFYFAGVLLLEQCHLKADRKKNAWS